MSQPPQEPPPGWTPYPSPQPGGQPDGTPPPGWAPPPPPAYGPPPPPPAYGPPPPGYGYGPPPPGWVPPPPETPWRRLDRRMLLVHPVTEVIRFLPVLVGIWLVGRDGDGWQLFGIVIPVLWGLWRFFTTSFRITETQVELKRGLISRKVLTARLDRVRSVELSSPLIHRLLGLAKVRIGTGSAATFGEDGFDLDALREPEAAALRLELLRTATPEPVATGAAGPGDPDGTGVAPQPDTREEEVLLVLDRRWARYAPFTSSGAVIAAGVLALAGQVVGAFEVGPSTELGWLGAVTDLPLIPVLLIVVVLLIVLGAVFGVLGYLVTNWGFTLTRDASGRSLRIRRGLLTTTDTSLELARVRGVELVEPLGLRSIGAARLQALVVGASLSEGGTSTIAPNCPRPTAVDVAEQVTGAGDPLDLPLAQHGPVARRRRFIRTLVPAAILVVGLAVASLYDTLPWWAPVLALLLLPLGALLAADRYRRLGHVLTKTHLVRRSGSLAGRHTVLDLDGVIGWHVQQSFFQRRGGVATLVATAAAGTQSYTVVDVPEPLAVALAARADPQLIGQFLRLPPTG